MCVCVFSLKKKLKENVHALCQFLAFSHSHPPVIAWQEMRGKEEERCFFNFINFKNVYVITLSIRKEKILLATSCWMNFLKFMIYLKNKISSVYEMKWNLFHSIANCEWWKVENFFSSFSPLQVYYLQARFFLSR